MAVHVPFIIVGILVCLGQIQGDDSLVDYLDAIQPGSLNTCCSVDDSPKRVSYYITEKSGTKSVTVTINQYKKCGARNRGTCFVYANGYRQVNTYRQKLAYRMEARPCPKNRIICCKGYVNIRGSCKSKENTCCKVPLSKTVTYYTSVKSGTKSISFSSTTYKTCGARNRGRCSEYSVAYRTHDVYKQQVNYRTQPVTCPADKVTCCSGFVAVHGHCVDTRFVTSNQELLRNLGSTVDVGKSKNLCCNITPPKPVLQFYFNEMETYVVQDVTIYKKCGARNRGTCMDLSKKGYRTKQRQIQKIGYKLGATPLCPVKNTVCCNDFLFIRGYCLDKSFTVNNLELLEKIKTSTSTRIVG
ncbi:unnamed protein product [Owenia fusiformis]|uniref:Uncharacterized protein n=1 Tax=Owenia fusiformis TaxID=6347 RepID=A0A8S4PGL2_OWEFU|nr:unnamed protein product [Owenia fusiformis]